MRQGYLPNITEHVVTRCGTPPSLNVVTNSQLFPAIQPMYASRWSSQLPEAYLPNTNGIFILNNKLITSICKNILLVPEVGRWSAETGSDNEFCHKTSSPNPLPNPDVTPDTYIPPVHSEQYVGRMHYDPHYILNTENKVDYMGKMIPHHDKNYQDYADRCSDMEEKHVNDKYLFPYTGKYNPMIKLYFQLIKIMQ